MASLASGTITASGATTGVVVAGTANVLLDFNGARANVRLERSFDNVNYYPLSVDASGNIARWSSSFNGIIDEPEASVYYRLNCTDYVSGTITYRISQ